MMRQFAIGRMVPTETRILPFHRNQAAGAQPTVEDYISKICILGPSERCPRVLKLPRLFILKRFDRFQRDRKELNELPKANYRFFKVKTGSRGDSSFLIFNRENLRLSFLICINSCTHYHYFLHYTNQQMKVYYSFIYLFVLATSAECGSSGVRDGSCIRAVIQAIALTMRDS